MPTTPILRTLLIHLWISIAFLALAFDPLGVVYEVAHLAQLDSLGILGGPAPAITRGVKSERLFGVHGDTFTDYGSAAQRSCNIQLDNCRRAANGDSMHSPSETVKASKMPCLENPPSEEQPSTSI